MKRYSLIIGFALLLRLVALSFRGLSLTTFGDSLDYLLAANSLCQGTPYPDATELPFFRAPGLPFFMVCSSFCQLNTVVTSKIALVVLDVVGMLIAMAIAFRLQPNRKIPLLAGLLYATSPLLIGQSTDLQSETLFQVALSGSVLAAMSGTLIGASASGALIAVAALTRPIALGFLPLAILGIALIHGRLGAKPLISFLVSLTLVLIPWGLFNLSRHGEFTLINDAFGYNFWRGNHPIMQQIYDAPDSSTLSQLSHELEHELTPTLVAETGDMSRRERSRFFFARGMEQLLRSPETGLALVATKIKVFLRPWPDPVAWGKLAVLVVGIWESALYLLSIATLLRLFRTKPRLVLFISVYLLAGLMLNLPFQVVTRFRVPIFEWVLIILAAIEVERYRNNFVFNRGTVPSL